MKNSLPSGIDMVYRFKPDGTYLYMNSKVAEFLGFSQEEMLGRHFLEFVKEDQHEEVKEFYYQQIRERQPSTYSEFQVRQKDGNFRWVGQSIELICENEEVVELLGVARDITEQKETLKKLDISDFRLRTVIDNMDAAILVEDENRVLQFVNQKFCQYFGIPAQPEELVGMDCALAAEQSKELFDDPESFLKGISKSLSNKVNHSGERLKLKDERVFERVYVPFYKGEVYSGHMWIYRDVTLRVLSDQAIKESEKKYREVIQNIDLGLMEVDTNETILFANKPFLEATGYELHEIVGKNAREVFLWEEDRKIHDEILGLTSEQRASDQSSAYELPLRAKNGDQLWFLISGAPIKDFEGKIIGSLGIHHNISDLKKLQGQLIYRTQLQETLLRLAGDLINIDLNQESNIINEALAQIGSFVKADRAYIFDYHFPENITSNTYEWCEEGIEPEITNLQEVPLDAIPDWPETHAKGEAMIHKDVMAMDPESPIRQILEPQGIQSIITVPIGAGEDLVGFIGFDAVRNRRNWTNTDVELLSFMAQLLLTHHHRKAASKRLEDTELMQRTILQSALDAVVIIDENGLVRFWNANAEEIFGYKEEETLGKSLSGIIIPEKFQMAHERGMQHYMETGEGAVLNQRIELVSIHRDGHSFPVELSIIPIKVGRRQLFASFLRDISARKKAEDDMNAALEQQKDLAKMKSRLISMASHEFRTPLTTIKANAEMLEIWSESLSEDLTEKAKKYFKRLNSEIDRLSNIMTDILIMGRLDSGKIKLKPRNVDLYDHILSYAERHYSNRQDKRELEVTLAGAPKLLPIDTEIFDHVLGNLVSNAFKYSKGSKNPKLTLNFAADYVRLSVIDYGIGIPEEEQNKIFNSFYRAENTRGFEGSGMGLAIVKQMTDMCNIELNVYSSLNEGTEFVLNIPYKLNNG